MDPTKAGGPGAPVKWADEDLPVDPSGAPAAAAKPRLLRALRRGLSTAYDYLGTVLVANVAWTAAAVLLGLGGSGLVALALEGHRAVSSLFAGLGGVVAAGIGTGPLTVALFHHARRLSIHDEPGWREIAPAIGALWRRGLGLAAVQISASLVMLVDGIFFLSQKSALLRLCGAGFIYPLLFWWGASLLQWPLAVDRPQDSLWLIVKKSFLLFLDNLTYMCLFGAGVLLATLLCLYTRVGLIVLTLGWAGTLAFLQTAIYRELLPKYGLLVPVEGDQTTDQ
jgi:hypothetical protein